MAKAKAKNEPKKTEAPDSPPPEKQVETLIREISVGKRQVQVTNLNHSPEKAGKQLVEKVDLSLHMILEQGDLDLWIESRRALAPSVELFDAEGNPAYPAMVHLPLEMQVEGSCILGPTGGSAKDMIKFKNALLKKPHLELMFGFKAKLSCQLRISPGGHLDQLGKLRIEGNALFSFSGESSRDEDSGDQQEMAM